MPTTSQLQTECEELMMKGHNTIMEGGGWGVSGVTEGGIVLGGEGGRVRLEGKREARWMAAEKRRKVG